MLNQSFDLVWCLLYTLQLWTLLVIMFCLAFIYWIMCIFSHMIYEYKHLLWTERLECFVMWQEVRPSKCAVDDAAAASPTSTCADPAGGKETVASAEPSDELASEEPACNSATTAFTGRVGTETSPTTASTSAVGTETSASEEDDSCATGDESFGGDTKKVCLLFMLHCLSFHHYIMSLILHGCLLCGGLLLHGES